MPRTVELCKSVTCKIISSDVTLGTQVLPRHCASAQFHLFSLHLKGFLTLNYGYNAI